MSNSTVSRLSELIGLEGAKRAVLRLSRPGSGVHAVLLYGSEGAGKETLAMALAQAWLCTSPTEAGACGACASCEAFLRDRSADLLKVVPRGPSEWIRQEAITPTRGDSEEELIPLTEFFRTPPLRSANKVALILRADRLYPSASNAFLKTLEEPHPYGKIVMTTAEIGLVLPTIVSRCVAVACELPLAHELRALQQDASADMLSLAEGAPGRLAHVLNHGEVYGRISEFARRLVSAPPMQALALSEEFRAICDGLQDALGCNARAANVEGLRALGSALSDLTDREDWLRLLAEAHRRILGNGNDGAVLDAMFAGMLTVASNVASPSRR